MFLHGCPAQCTVVVYGVVVGVDLVNDYFNYHGAVAALCSVTQFGNFRYFISLTLSRQKQVVFELATFTPQCSGGVQ